MIDAVDPFQKFVRAVPRMRLLSGDRLKTIPHPIRDQTRGRIAL